MTAPDRIYAAPPWDDPQWESGAGEWDVSDAWAQDGLKEYVNADRVAQMVQEARDQAFREAAKAAGDAAVVVLMRHCFDAPALMQQARRRSVAVPVLRLIGTAHPTVAGDDR